MFCIDERVKRQIYFFDGEIKFYERTRETFDRLSNPYDEE